VDFKWESLKISMVSALGVLMETPHWWKQVKDVPSGSFRWAWNGSYVCPAIFCPLSLHVGSSGRPTGVPNRRILHGAGDRSTSGQGQRLRFRTLARGALRSNKHLRPEMPYTVLNIPECALGRRFVLRASWELFILYWKMLGRRGVRSISAS
jgi:hypothetical protein